MYNIWIDILKVMENRGREKEMYKIYTDGSYINNGLKAGNGGIGIYGIDENGKNIIAVSKYIGNNNKYTSTIMEYTAMEEALKILKDNHMDNIIIYNDFIGLINTMSYDDKMGIRGPLISMHDRLVELRLNFSNIKFRYIETNNNLAHKYAYSAAYNKSGNTIKIDSIIQEGNKSLENINAGKKINSMSAANTQNLQNTEIHTDKDYSNNYDELLGFLKLKGEKIKERQDELNNMIEEQAMISNLLGNYASAVQQINIISKNNTDLKDRMLAIDKENVELKQNIQEIRKKKELENKEKEQILKVNTELQNALKNSKSLLDEQTEYINKIKKQVLGFDDLNAIDYKRPIIAAYDIRN